jgi:hypothetical protein
MSFFDDASLVMIPSGYKDQKIYSVKPTDGTGDLTFSRASSATRVASDGLIEKVRTNLLQQSQNLAAAAWSLGGTATRTANYGTAPDGTQTSTRIQWTNAAGFELYQYTGFAAPIYGSVYIKGTASQTIKYSGNSVTLNGSWQRIQGAIAIDGANTFFTIVGTTGVNTAFDFELWGAQAETGDIATDYIATTTAAVSVGPVSGLPRLDYLGSTCPRLLLEPQRSSLYTFSEQIDNAAWGKTNVSVTANNTASPDGYTNADKVVANTTNGVHRVEQDRATATQVATQSVFAKASGYNFIALENGGELAYFNISTGVVGAVSGGTASIQDYGNGWYRCIFTATAANTKSYIYIASANNTASFAGDNTSGAFIYGAQFEAGAYATSYIPTLGASVTRVVDKAEKTSASALIGQTEGTIFWEIQVDIQSASGNEQIFTIDNGSTYDNSIYLAKGETGSLVAVIVVGAVVQATFSVNKTTGTFKMAIGYANNNSAFFVDGVQVSTTDTSCSIPASLSRITLGNTPLGSTSGKTAQVLLFPTRLTNAQLAELTA